LSFLEGISPETLVELLYFSGAVSCYPLYLFIRKKADKKDAASIRARAFSFLNSNYGFL
jgi:hypothetical protein